MIRNVALIALIGALVACTTAESEYDTTHSAAFIYRQVSNKQALRSALDGSGIYCMVWYERGKYYFSNSLGQTDSDNLPAITGGVPYQSLSGFIVGRAANIDFSGQQPRYAWDRACPNCNLYDHIVRPVEFCGTLGTQVQCPRCHRVYELESGGILTEGRQNDTDIKLYRYHISYDGGNNLQIYN